MLNFLKNKKNKEAFQKKYKIEGMHCASCALVIESDLEDFGINGKCSYQKSELTVSGEHSAKNVEKIVKKSGYSIVT